jgi:hypothetical protein
MSCYIYINEPNGVNACRKNGSRIFKKATGKTFFTCEEGLMIKETIERAIERGEAKTFRARSIGKNAEGLMVAQFYITWSFKARN